MEISIDLGKLGRTSIRPLQVYLDSNDYSDLSKAMDDAAHPHATIYRDLCEFVDQGKIEIRFTAVHIIEMAHLDARSKDSAIARARCLKRLAGDKCFRYWLDAAGLEARDLLSGRPMFESVANDNAVWHPDLSNLAPSFKGMVTEGIKKFVAEATTNRHQRRVLMRRFFPNGQFSNRSIQLLKDSQRDSLLTSLSEQFPLSERFWRDDLMLKFVEGEVGADEIAYEVGLVFRDVATFIGWTYDTRGKQQQLVGWLRNFGHDLNNKIETLRSRYETLVRPSMPDARAKNKISEILKSSAQEIRRSRLVEVREEAKRLRPPLYFSDTDWKDVLDSPFGSIPTLDAYIVGFGEYFLRNIRMARTLKSSDAADLFHIAYMPYCELYRADGDTSELIKPFAKSFGTEVVSKLRDLPKRIQEALVARA